MMEQIVKNNLGYIRADIHNLIKRTSDLKTRKGLKSILWKLSEEYLESKDGSEKKALYNKYEPHSPKEDLQEEIKHWQKQREEAEKILKDILLDKDGMMLDDDKVNPLHYQSMVKDLNVDAITCMRAAFGDEAVQDFCVCNALKYLYRHRSKGGKTDLKKCKWYLNKYLELNK